MKIAWFCIPAYGHTNPSLEVVKAMTNNGHEVYYFSFNAFKDKIEKAGAHFIPCDDYPINMESEGDGEKNRQRHCLCNRIACKCKPCLR